jgi:hypothetical protein
MAAAITTTATTLEGQFFEISNAMQDAELAQPEATRPNRITVGFDTEALTYTVTASINVNTSGTGGNRIFTPVPYLP